jgi:alpha-tubulin suppressor-like RCC1 family protein
MGDKLGSIDMNNTITPTNTPTKTATPTKTVTKSKTVTRSKTPTNSKTRTATPVGGAKEVVSVVTGDGHACAILANDTVKCWGNNSVGQLGYGDKVTRGDGADEMGSSLAAVDLGRRRTAKAISAGAAHPCAILDNNSVKCWGLNNDGQLGLDDTDSRGDGTGEMGDDLDSVYLGSGRTAKAIASSGYYTCALLDDSSVKCWGFNGYGQFGVGTSDTSAHTTPQTGMNGSGGVVITGISCGYNHLCALTNNGTVICSGDNVRGQLGCGSGTTYFASPQTVNGIP